MIQGNTIGVPMRAALWSALLGSFCLSCRRAGESGTLREKSDGASAEVATDAGTSTDDEEFVPGQESTPIAGINLTFDNARVRCDYQDADAGGYDVQCDATAVQPDGREIRPETLAAGTTATWRPPQAITSAAESIDCTVAANGLTQFCHVEILPSAPLLTLRFPLAMADTTTQRSKTESVEVVLPYAVEVAAGLVPNIPFSYASEESGTALTDAGPESDAPTRGFAPVSMPADTTAFNSVSAVCRRGNTLFFAHDHYVYRNDGSGIVLFAGSTKTSGADDTSHRFRIALGLIFDMACADDGVIVSDPSHHRILKLKDAGPVEIVAGVGSSGYSPDGTLAREARLASPEGVVLDQEGHLYFSESENGIIRTVDADGRLSTVAGTGTSGTVSDGMAARSAPIGMPFDISLAANGDLLVTDVGQSSVWRLTVGGTIRRLAGTGNTAAATTVPVSGGSARATDLRLPLKVIEDQDGNVVFTEVLRAIRRIETDGTITSLLINTSDAEGDALLYSQSAFTALFLNSDGTIWFDWPQGLAQLRSAQAPISVIGPTNDTPLIGCAGPTDAGQARFISAPGVTYSNDAIFVADWRQFAGDAFIVKRIAASDGAPVVTVPFGCAATLTSSRATDGSLQGFVSIGATFYFADPSANKIWTITADASPTLFAGSGAATSTGDNGDRLTATFNVPVALAAGPDGALFVVERDGNRIRRIGADGIVTTVAGNGTEGASGEGGPATAAAINPTGLAIGAAGELFFSDANHTIRRVDVDGMLTTIAGTGTSGLSGDGGRGTLARLNDPQAIGVTNSGVVYFIDAGNERVRRLAKDSLDRWTIDTLIGDSSNIECGTGRVAGAANATDLNQAVHASVSMMCHGTPRALAVKDTCPGPGGITKIAVTQGFVDYANVIEITTACP